MSNSTPDDQGPTLNVDDLLFFSGKELNDAFIAGKRSLTQPIRLAVGIHGVYKFHPEEDKVLSFWGYSNIQDWNYSGYSFTLTFKSKRNYDIRTNDGPAISHWIDAFSKNPDQAIVASKQFKSLGQNTTRTFSAELRPINYQPKFYTLNTRKKHTHHTEQSRMMSAYGVDRKHSSSQQLLTQSHPPNEIKRWSADVSSSNDEKKQSIRSSSAEIIDKYNHTSEFRTQSMECLSNGKTSSPPPPIPLHLKKHSLQEILHEDMSTEQYPFKRSILPPKIIKNSLSPTSSSEYDDPPVPPRISSLHTSQVVKPPDKPNTTPLGNKTIPPPRNMSGTTHCTKDQEYNVLIKVTDEGTTSRLSPHKHRPHTYEEIEIGPNVERYKPYNRLGMKSPDSSHMIEGSGEYDHLFPGKKKSHNAFRKKNTQLEEEDEVVHSPVRRNESLPPMILHSPLRENPSLEVSQDEESVSDFDEDDDPISPLPGETQLEGVVLRRKPSGESIGDGDPFVDLLTAPTRKSRLRWSQELNPIYDYIRGIKVSPTVGYDLSGSLATTPENIIREEPLFKVGDDNVETSSIGSNSDHQSSYDSQFEGLVLVPQSAPNTLQRVKRPSHNYEQIFTKGKDQDEEEEDGRIRTNSRGNRPLSEHYSEHGSLVSGHDEHRKDTKSQTLSMSPLRRIKSSGNAPFVISPRLNKRVIHNRRSRTVISVDDNAPQRRQRAHRVADTMKDFSYITREYRVFFIKLPNGMLISEVVNINKPVSVLIDKLSDIFPTSCNESLSMYVEGAVLTTMKEATLEFGELQSANAQVDRSVSLNQLVDNNSLADQGPSPILLKNNLSLRMQGITTSRILRLDDTEDLSYDNVDEVDTGNEFHKTWLAVVQGNQPTTLDNAVKLAAMQYQAYFLERTAENSVIGFCRPTEFLPAEFSGVRGIEQRMYKEQEKIKSKSHSDIQKSYVQYCNSLPTSQTLFFPVREPRRRLLQSARLKPVLLGVNKRGIMRVCPKTKEVLDSWEYQVLKNWAYSRRTFVLAFNNKNYPVESNQAKWISELVDFFVESIVRLSHSPPRSK